MLAESAKHEKRASFTNVAASRKILNLWFISNINDSMKCAAWTGKVKVSVFVIRSRIAVAFYHASTASRSTMVGPTVTTINHNYNAEFLRFRVSQILSMNKWFIRS